MATKKALARPAPKASQVIIDSQSGTISVGGLPPRVWVSLGLTLNRGNYESARIDAGCSMDVPPGKTFAGAFETAWSMAENEVKRQFIAVRAAFPASPAGETSNPKRRY